MYRIMIGWLYDKNAYLSVKFSLPIREKTLPIHEKTLPICEIFPTYPWKMVLQYTDYERVRCLQLIYI